MSLSTSEKQLIMFIRDLGWGEVEIRVEKGKPVLICEAIRTFKLLEQSVNAETSTKKTKGRLTAFK
ncbi:hypothetical protein SAMN05660649_01970 [Desulfotomaculum arcticum]|uniref:Uncharacterized protein n=1 Tax=Desulfotruncus arcticus DSM 17038 TaxID=1121424 RepID=A0A1I2SZ63_9FIRM|nr:hypothetical protein SAMN05660649_01970 [Desulfotomaculum arcticum] [Desulfotruncus arcticus DSM 17038]